MNIKIIQAHTLEELEAEINAWLETPSIEVLNGNIHYQGDWRSCYAVLWYKEGTDQRHSEGEKGGE